MNFCKKSHFTAVLFLLGFGFCSVPSFIYAQVQEITGSVSIQGAVDIEADPNQLDRTFPLGLVVLNSDNILSTPENNLINQDLSTNSLSRDGNYFNNHPLDANGYHKSYFAWHTVGGTSSYKDENSFYYQQNNASQTSFKPESGNREDLNNSSPWVFGLSIPTFQWSYFKQDCSKAIFGSNTFFYTLRNHLKKPRLSDPLNFKYDIDAFNQGHVFKFTGALLSANNANYTRFSTIWTFFRNLFYILVLVFLYFLTFKVITCF